MVSSQKEKIRELKKKLAAVQTAVVKLRTQGLGRTSEEELSDEDKKKELGKLRTERISLEEQIKQIRANPTGSSAVEFKPTPPNRAARKLMRKYMR